MRSERTSARAFDLMCLQEHQFAVFIINDIVVM